MQTKYNVGDTVLIKGTIRRIEITREGEICYDVDTEGSGITNYGFSRVSENDIRMWKEKENDYLH